MLVASCSAGVPPAVARASCPRRSERSRRGAHMKPKYFKTLAVVLVLTVVAAIAVAQGMRRGHMMPQPRFARPTRWTRCKACWRKPAPPE